MTTVALLASLTTLGYTASYLILCAVVPFGRCWHCRHRNNRRGRRDCRWCDNTRRRVRIGRRIFEYVRSEYHRGTR